LPSGENLATWGKKVINILESEFRDVITKTCRLNLQRELWQPGDNAIKLFRVVSYKFLE
jgi:hypothetical protein